MSDQVPCKECGRVGDVDHIEALYELLAEEREGTEDASDASKTFEQAWAEKEAAGYRYGDDALCNVRFGWNLAMEQLAAEREAREKDEIQIITERDMAEDAVGELYEAVTGFAPEWSNQFNYTDAVEQVETEVTSLRARVAELEAKLPRKLSDEDDSSVEPFV